MATRKTTASAAKKPASKHPKKTASKTVKKRAATAPKKAAGVAAKKNAPRKTTVKASNKPGPKSNTVKAAAKPGKTLAKKPAKTIAAKSSGKQATASAIAARRKPSPAHVTPEQALSNTLALLEAKNEKARHPPTYPSAGDAHTHLQSGDTTENHAASQPQVAPGNRPEVIEGHSLPRGNQGKRNPR